MNFNIPKLNIPKLEMTKFETIIPKNISLPDTKMIGIINAIDNIQNINRLRDMDNLSYQIKMRNQQKNVLEKKLNSIISTLDIKVGIIISILIIIFSVIIPFFIVASKQYFEQYQTIIYIYIIVSFGISMLSMILYLLWYLEK